MKLIVDTNIVFSGILNTSSRIGNILIHSRKYFEFYSCDFLKSEISKHKSKLIKLTKLSESELEELTSLVTANITFIHESLIPKDHLKKAEELLKDTDPSDSPFVALADFLGSQLWTGDLELIKGLRSKKFKQLITTSELLKIIEKSETKKRT